MIDGTEKSKIPQEFAKRAARYNEFGSNAETRNITLLLSQPKSVPKYCLPVSIERGWTDSN